MNSGTIPSPYLGNTFRLQRADAVGLDINLIGERWYAKHAPRSAVVVHFLDKNVTAQSYGLLKLLLRGHIILRIDTIHNVLSTGIA